MLKHTFCVHFILCRCCARLQRETFGNSLLVFPFLLFLMLHEDRFCVFVHEFTCVTSDLKNAVSPRDGTITSRSINTEGGTAALVLTRKQRRSWDRSRLSGIEQFSSSNFSNVCCLSCCHIAFIVRSHFLIDREAAVPSLP